MEPLATQSDVEDRLGYELDEEQTSRIKGLLEEASLLVQAHVGKVPEPVPDAVRVVVSRMVARVFTAPANSFDAQSTSVSAGPFSRSVTFNTGASGGAPWLTAVDKQMLRPFGRGGIYTIGIC